MSVEPTALPPVTSGGPCADLRYKAEQRCAEAQRRADSAAQQQQVLRDLRREEALVAEQREADARMRDRRYLAEAKTQAQRAYHASLARATVETELQEAADEWLRAVDGLNRQARLAGARADVLARRASELQGQLPAAEVAADAARIAADAAEIECMEARRAAVECEESARTEVPLTERAGSATTSSMIAGEAARLHEVPAAIVPEPANAHVGGAVPGQPVGSDHLPTGSLNAAWSTGPAPAGGQAAVPLNPAVDPPLANGLRELLEGDRGPVLHLAMQLAERTGLEAGRLQLLLLELREAIEASALADHALRFPAQHPFWSQFNRAGAARIISSLASLGFRFDGDANWVDERAPSIRDLAMALSYSGFDPRSLRRPAGQAAIDALWQGAAVVPAEWLLEQAPDLELAAVSDSLGQRGARLGELWAIWNQLRPLLSR